MGSDLPGGLVALLHARTRGNAPASRRRDRSVDDQHRKAVGHLLDGGSRRKSASPPEWDFASQGPIRASAWTATRKRVVVLSAIFRGDAVEDRQDRFDCFVGSFGQTAYLTRS